MNCSWCVPWNRSLQVWTWQRLICLWRRSLWVSIRGQSLLRRQRGGVETPGGKAHRLNTQKPESSFIWMTLCAHNTDATEFRLCVSLLGPFTRLSIVGIWPLCKQCNSTTNPPIFTSLQRDLKEGGASTIHEWKVTQLLLLIQAYLFNLWGKCIVSRWLAANGHIKNRILWHNEGACAKKKNLWVVGSLWGQEHNAEAVPCAAYYSSETFMKGTQLRQLCLFNRLH